MALPIVTAMKHELIIPSSGDKVTFRPFLVKEEKILMMAMQSGESKDMVRALNDIIKNCVEEEIDTSKLALFDIEYIFLHLRAKSIGEIVEVSYSEPDVFCEKNKNQKCIFELKVNLDEIKVIKDDKHNSLVDITDKIKVKLKYPKIEDTENFESIENVDSIFKLIISCIDYIMDGEEMHKTSDYTEKEVDTFLSSLSADQFKNITTFFETMPRVSKDVTGKCGQCGKEQNKTLTGVQDFFG